MVDPLPCIKQPMAATQLARPFHRDGRVYEEKYDGWRIVAYTGGMSIKLIGRAGKDHSRRFGDLVAAIRALPSMTLILDGEVAIIDDQLISRFEWLRASPKDEVATPPMMMVFDCLQLGADDLRPQPLRVRRDHVEQLLDGAPAVLLPVRRLADDGLKAWQQVLDHGWEGLVAKDAASPYVGGRSLKWLKVKVPRYREGERGWEPTMKS